MIILSAPIVKQKKVMYYINKPNGDVNQLHLPVADNEAIHDLYIKDEYDNVEANFIENLPTVLNREEKYKIFNVNFGQTLTSNDIFKEKYQSLLANEFMIGPLDFDDHGNWMLSLYYKDGMKWIEVFQVISIIIIGKLTLNSSCFLHESIELKICH